MGNQITFDIGKPFEKKKVEKVKKKTTPQTVNVTPGALTNVSASVVRNVPTEVLVQIKTVFPKAKNNTDALMAYLACCSNDKVADTVRSSLTTAQVDLVKNWDGVETSVMQDQITSLNKQIQSMRRLLETMEMMLSYITFDRLGFRQDNPPTPRDTNFREDGMLELVLKAESQNKGFQIDKEAILGRPIR